MDITGYALVVGGGSGIGKACALAFAREGAAGVFVADINIDAAKTTVAESQSVSQNPSCRCKAVHADVTSSTSVDAAVQDMLGTFGRVDYCVVSAGIGAQAGIPVAEADPQTFRRFMEVNVTGTFNVNRAVSAAMKTQEPRPVRGFSDAARGSHRGAIVNMGSALSHMATPGVVQYTTSKHAVLGLGKTAALDNAEYGIRVNCLCPGWVDTPMLRDASAGMPGLEPMIQSVVPMGRRAHVSEVADAALFLCSPRSSYMTGCGIIMDGGASLGAKI